VQYKELPLSSVLTHCAAEAADINSIAEVPSGLTASGSYKEIFVCGKTYCSSLDTHSVGKYGIIKWRNLNFVK
jgi:hypothetical protein